MKRGGLFSPMEVLALAMSGYIPTMKLKLKGDERYSPCEQCGKRTRPGICGTCAAKNEKKVVGGSFTLGE